MKTLTVLLASLAAACGITSAMARGAELAAVPRTDQRGTEWLDITIDNRSVANFVYRDDRIRRPYFSQLHSLGGDRLTRRHPPVAGADAVDHDTMHPGLWLGFGDINGHDFWRNKGHIQAVGPPSPPAVRDGRMTFAVESQLRTGELTALGRLTNRFEIAVGGGWWTLVWDATFHADPEELVFGDQEEMGCGARVATPLIEKNGGRLVSASGKRTAAATWGQPAAWCDYSGITDGRRVGITLIASPDNFRPSWWHNRDYGLFVANPFGRSAMKQGPASRVVVPRGQTLRLVFAAVMHDGPNYDPEQAYVDLRRRLPR